ncbi:DNA cytosine methyltransferase [Paenibacillus polymyxa]|uniref:DNA cytosine methyltransferase n=1 Tax=Paenibacillus polymyxa TaxID=1406 RepID=UPI0025B6606B|nr:DNA cytosine methyltransferase [Paenibacillus polymyxa]MDN4090928.1 DNA cytosine methyltransferase [Paenibacillus polymyxa]
MNHLSLFSGIGGIDLACHWAGMRTIAFCEREPFPRAVLAKQFPGVPIYDDVCTLTAARLKEDGLLGPGRTIDLISAGYPCQPFSNAGKRKGTEDDRHLWPEVARILREIRPRWFIGENVAGHISLGLDDVLAELESIGYTGQAFVIPSAAVGAPHRRDRVFVVAYTDSVGHSSQQGCAARSDGEKDSEQWEHFFCGLGNYGEVVAHSSSKGLEGDARTELSRKCSRSSMRGENVAYSTSFRQPESRKSLESSDTAKSEAGQTSEPLHDRIGAERATQPCLGGVSDGISVGLDKYRRVINNGFTDESRPDLVDTSTYSQGMKRSALSRSYRWSRSKFRNQFTRGGTTQSSMGRVLDGLSARLDQQQWPAGLGQPQHDWEPPRTAAGVKNRVGRLKALGNAVNPLQIYPVVAAISHIHSEHVRKGRRLPTTVKRTSVFRKRTLIKKLGENENT